MAHILPFSHHFPILAILKHKDPTSVQEVTQAITQVLAPENILALNFNIKSHAQGDIYYLNIVLRLQEEAVLTPLYEALTNCPAITQLF